MDGTGLVENGVFAKTLRMLAGPYKSLKNVAIDSQTHCRILKKMHYKCCECLQMPLQIMRTSCKYLTNETPV